jgi:hypothetical protein
MQMLWITHGNESKSNELNFVFSIILPVVGFAGGFLNGLVPRSFALFLVRLVHASPFCTG